MIFLILVINSGLGKWFGKTFKASRLGRLVSTKTRCSSWWFKEVANTVIAQRAKAAEIKFFSLLVWIQQKKKMNEVGEDVSSFPLWQREMFRISLFLRKAEQQHSLWHYVRKRENAGSVPCSRLTKAKQKICVENFLIAYFLANMEIPGNCLWWGWKSLFQVERGMHHDLSCTVSGFHTSALKERT